MSTLLICLLISSVASTYAASGDCSTVDGLLTTPMGANQSQLVTSLKSGAQSLGLIQKTQITAFADRLHNTVLSQTLPSWEKLYNTQILIFRFMGNDPSLLTTVPLIPIGMWGTVAELLMCYPNASTTTSATTNSSTASTSIQSTASTTTARPANCSTANMVLTLSFNGQSELANALRDYSNTASNLGMMEKISLTNLANRIHNTVLTQSYTDAQKLELVKVLLIEFVKTSPERMAYIPPILLGTWGTVGELMSCPP